MKLRAVSRIPVVIISLVAVIVFAFVMITTDTPRVEAASAALGSISPNTADYEWAERYYPGINPVGRGGAAGVYNYKLLHVISQTSDTSPQETALAVYYDNWGATETKTITIRRPISPGYDSQYVESASLICSGNISITVRIGGSVAPGANPRQGCSGVNSIYGNYTVSSAKRPSLDAETGKYKLEVSLKRTGGSGRNLFEVSAPGGVIGTLGSQPASYDSTRGDYKRVQKVHEFKFGSDCTINNSSGEFRQITLYDPDNDDPDVQFTPLQFYIKEIDKVTGVTRILLKSDYKNTVNMSYRTNDLWQPTAPNKKNTTFEIRMIPDKSYRIVLTGDNLDPRLRGVDTNNTLLFQLPTDAIFHDVTCQDRAEVSRSMTLTPIQYVMEGQDINAKFYVTSGSSSSTRVPGEMRVWKDEDGGRDYDPGEDVLYDFASVERYGGADPNLFVNPSATKLAMDYSYKITGSDVANVQKICASFRIDQPAADASVIVTASSKLLDTKCVDIGKAPFVTVTGGDVISRQSRIWTTQVDINGYRHGSWGEYAMFAAGQLRSNSASSLAGGDARLLATPDTARLSFANAGSGAVGNFDMISAIRPNFISSFDASTAWSTSSIMSAGMVPVASLQQNRINTYSGTLHLAGGTVSGSKIVRVDGSVIISGDILTDNPSVSNPLDFSQLIIVASGNITINSDVTRVDAWLQAGGTLSTCDSPSTPYYQGLTTGNCNKQLTINGPVSADVIQLRRTAGNDGATKQSHSEPGERFNLRPDAYLWAYAQSGETASGSTTIDTTYVTELSPRY